MKQIIDKKSTISKFLIKLKNSFIILLKKLYYKALNLRLQPRNWMDIEYFDESWKGRIRAMVRLINNEKSVLDLGCGKMWLKEFLDKDIKYIGVDYKKRSDDCLVCDFNNNEFPNVKADVCFLSGTLEYIKDLNWFFDQVSNNCNAVILSYCTRDLSPEIRVRKNFGWVNHLSSKELIEMLESKGFAMSGIPQRFGVNEIFKFIKN